MEHAGIVILAILSLMVAMVLVPYCVSIYATLRTKQVVSCPNSHRDAIVSVDALRSALRPLSSKAPRVVGCTEWPERATCQQLCAQALRP